ncbi:MAG: FAD-dependent oxidoreductase [Cocleimonas sp.]
MKTYDLIILGGGRSSVMAVEVANSGKKVALIEKDKLGGSCPNRGCVPSKLLIGYAEVARKVREASEHFIEADIKSIDVARMFRETNDWSAQVDARYESRHPESLDLYRGHGTFIDDHTIEVNGEKLTSKNIVIATGSRPRKGPFSDLPLWTSDDLFPLNGEVPESITIVGGGFIAVELANFFNAVGVKTTMLVRSDRLLPAEDKDIASIFTDQFSKVVDTRFNTNIESASYDGKQFSLQLNNANDKPHQTERLLYAIGRELNTNAIGLENTQIKRDESGLIIRDETLQTSVSGVYAMGDVASPYMLQHIAAFESNYICNRILEGSESSISHGAIAHAVFSNPEVAAVGMTEEQTAKSGRSFIAVTEDWTLSARALSTKLTYPRTKLIVDTNSFEVLGCHLIGPEASTMIHEVIMLMHLNNDIRQLTKMIHIHPALPEALVVVARKALDEIDRL